MKKEKFPDSVKTYILKKPCILIHSKQQHILFAITQKILQGPTEFTEKTSHSHETEFYIIKLFSIFQSLFP